MHRQNRYRTKLESMDNNQAQPFMVSTADCDNVAALSGVASSSKFRLIGLAYASKLAYWPCILDLELDPYECWH